MLQFSESEFSTARAERSTEAQPTTTDQAPSLADQLIRLLATSYVRRERHFYHIDRPSESMTREDLQRAFLIPAQRLNNGQPVSSAVMKEVFNTAIIQNNADADKPCTVRGAVCGARLATGSGHRCEGPQSGGVTRNRCRGTSSKAAIQTMEPG